jgi:streptogramin lyase
VVFKEFDVPLASELNVPAKDPMTDGSDWSLGTPSRRGSLVHDATADLEGNLWFTSNVPNRNTTVGRIDTKTGAVKMFKVNGPGGLAANTHGITRDPNGIIWFDVNAGRRGLARLDPKTEKIDVHIPPTGMSPTGGAVTVDYDGKGQIWASSPDGALRFNPETEKFTEFKSVTLKTPNGNGVTYGAAGDRNGNGWWAEMIIDTINKGDVATGRSIELKLPRREVDKDLINDEGSQVL